MNQQCMGRRLRPRTAVCPLSSCHFLSGRILERWNGRKVWQKGDCQQLSHGKVESSSEEEEEEDKEDEEDEDEEKEEKDKDEEKEDDEDEEEEEEEDEKPKKSSAKKARGLAFLVIKPGCDFMDLEYKKTRCRVSIILIFCSYIMFIIVHMCWIATFLCAPATYGAVPAPWVSHMRFSHVHDPSEGLHFSWRVAPERLKLSGNENKMCGL